MEYECRTFCWLSRYRYSSWCTPLLLSFGWVTGKVFAKISWDKQSLYFWITSILISTLFSPIWMMHTSLTSAALIPLWSPNYSLSTVDCLWLCKLHPLSSWCISYSLMFYGRELGSGNFRWLVLFTEFIWAIRQPEKHFFFQTLSNILKTGFKPSYWSLVEMVRDVWRSSM